MKLGVNIDHVATLRQARMGFEPDPVHAACVCELAGADGITVHLRADRRHMQDRDVKLLKSAVSTRLNVEMAATTEMVEIAAEVQPWQVTLVPERPNEVTTEGGLDVLLNETHLKQVVDRLHSHNIRVSVFVDPHLDNVKGTHRIGAQALEINTNAYAIAKSRKEGANQLVKIKEAGRMADKLGIEVLAGHALNYRNVVPVTEVEEIAELNIGHSIIARAVFVGLERAVTEMKALMP